MDQDEIQLLLDQARITLNKGRTREAEKFIEKVLGHEPDNDQALNLKGLLLFKDDRYGEAVGLFQKLLSMFPGEPTLLTNLGLALLKSEQLVEAETVLQEALEAGGNADKINNYLGLVMSGLGKYEDAQNFFEAGGSKKMAEQMLALMGMNDPIEDEVAEKLEDSTTGDEPSTVAPPEESTAQSSTEKQAPPKEQPDVPIPELRDMGNADVLSVALKALGERFGGVLETSDFGQNLQHLAEVLSVHKRDDDVESPYPNVVRLAVHEDPIYVRNSLVLGSENHLSTSVQNKKYKGKELSAPFGGEDDSILRIEGKGNVVLHAAEHNVFHAVPLEEELIYIAERHVGAFAGELRFENGRLPSDDGYDLDLVQFRGTGKVFIHGNEKLIAIPVTGEDGIAVDYNRVVGWFGNTVPALAATRPPFHENRPKLITFKGSGIVLASCQNVKH